MKILILSSTDIAGGAARAAYRIHRAFLEDGMDSKMRVGRRFSDDISVEEPARRTAKFSSLLTRKLSERLSRLQKVKFSYSNSISLFGSWGLVNEINRSDADIVNLHWICGEFLSVAQIGRIRKPIVWTMHDMWSFCGSEHYAPDDESARWRRGYGAGTRLPGEMGVDLDRIIWRRKRQKWRKPLHVVTPSRWLGDCVKGSALMKQLPVSVIPYPLDLSVFKPWPRSVAREAMGLPKDARIVLFGALGRDPSGRKGLDLLLDAVEWLKAEEKSCGWHLAIFGQSEPAEPPRLGFPIHWMGRLHDDISLALLYSAADVMVVPSRMDNLPQTGVEAQACGCPVVAFKTCGLPDVLEDRESGYLATPFDSADLANGIAWVIEDRQRLSEAARARALREWNSKKLVDAYRQVFSGVLEGSKCRIIT